MTYLDLGLTQEHFNFLMAFSGILFSFSVSLVTLKMFLK